MWSALSIIAATMVVLIVHLLVIERYHKQHKEGKRNNYCIQKLPIKPDIYQMHEMGRCKYEEAPL